MKTLILSSVVISALNGFALAADAIPHPEHPRPDFTRSAWVNLNGTWQFDFDAQDEGETQQWFVADKHKYGRQIVVPFPWESKLSGIGDTKYKGVAWYAREITLPAGKDWDGKDAWLVVGACDWEAKVWVNGKPAGEHVGGYVPFAVNLAPFAKAGEKVFVVIRAKDISDYQQPTGKQVHWYTRNSGIWQTVYLEARGRSFVENFRFTCEPVTGKAGVSCPIRYAVQIHQPAAGQIVQLQVNGKTIGEGAEIINAEIESPKYWSPGRPNLYEAKLVLKQGDQVLDEVSTYFGLRSVDVAKASDRDYKYIRLNGSPVYLLGALHQSFHPDGIYQYPDDATVRSDYELCKQIGLNMLRIHIKIPTPRELYWADKLGVLIMQDMPCFWKYTEQAQKWYVEMLHDSIARDFNHPAIFSWVTFNETWGIEDGGYTPEHRRWVAEMWALAKKLDPTRLVEDNSPCKYDHVITDINSWHFYINDYAAAAKHIQEVVDKTSPGSTFNYAEGYKQADAPLINSEYGGIGAGSGDTDISWCFKFLTNELRKHDKICGYVYTELSDIEWEHNGFVNYDRSAKEYGYDFWHPGFSLKDLNSLDFVVLDAEPCIVLKAGEKKSVPVLISHWSDRELKDVKLRWRIDWMDRYGKRYDGQWQMRPVACKPYAVASQDPIDVAAPADMKPAESGRLGALLVEMVDGDNVLARSYLNLSIAETTPRTEVPEERTLVLRWKPADYSAWQWENQEPSLSTGIAIDKAWATGAGWVEYQLALPDAVASENLESIRLVAELSAKAKDEKLAWPDRRSSGDYPQTDVNKWPTDVQITINGQKAATMTLPDDPADARGVLSHLHGHQPGSYGQLVEVTLASDALKKAVAQDGKKFTIRIEVPADAQHRGGLAVFGERLGAYPVDPTCVLTFGKPHKMTVGGNSDKPVAVNRLAALQQVLVPDGGHGGCDWRFTMQQPSDDWFSPDFNDEQWKSARSGFGTRETPNTFIGKSWRTKDIWIRTHFDLKDAADILSAKWSVYHDEDMELYLNGKKVLDRKGFVTDYFDVPLDASVRSLLRDGRNVVAVHCRQTEGGQYIDVGLTAVRKK